MYQVSSQHLVRQPTLVMTTSRAAVAEIHEFLKRAFGEVYQEAARLGIEVSGPPFARYRPLDPGFSQFEIEAGFPVKEAVAKDAPVAHVGQVKASALPEADVASVVHIGPFDRIMPAYQAINAWLASHAGLAVGSAWEVYYSDPAEEPDPNTWRTEIFQPYAVKA